jgi:tetratricopeptide (TPR) repeat protein
MKRTLAVALVLTLQVSAPGFLAAQADTSRGLRAIFVGDASEAESLRNRILGGEPFGLLARDFSLDTSAGLDGFLGRFTATEMRLEFRTALGGLAPGQISPVVRVGDTHVLLELLTDEEMEWRAAMAAAFAAVQEGRNSEARERYVEAAALAGGFGADDYRQAMSLADLAAVHRIEGAWSEGERGSREALRILEAVRGPGHAEVAQALNRLGEMLILSRDAEKLPEAEDVFRRSLDILEIEFGPGHMAVVTALTHLGLVLQARQEYDEAESVFVRAIQVTEANRGPEHPEVAASLEDLAGLYILMEHYAEAEPVAARALGIVEAAAGTDSRASLGLLGNLARVYGVQGRYAESVAYMERALEIEWGARVPASGVVEAIDALTHLLHRAPFGGPDYEDARARFEAVLAESVPGEGFYRAVAAILVAAELTEEAEQAMRAGVGTYPNSLRVLRDLAETSVDSSRTETALGIFTEASRLAEISGASPRERSFFLRRRGDMLVELLRYDEAGRRFREALDLDPDSLEAQISASDFAFLSNDHEEALEGFRRVLETDPGNLLALRRFAEVNLLLNRYEAAADAARRAVRIDPGHARTRYLSGMALTRTGDAAGGQSELAAYQRLQAEEEARDQRDRGVAAANDEVSRNLRMGDYEEALRLARDAVEAFPDAGLLRMVLILIESETGNDRGEVDPLSLRTGTGTDDYFLIHAALAAGYAALGEEEAHRRYRASYLRQAAAALRSALEPAP